MIRIAVILATLTLAACGSKPQTAEVRKLPPACQALPDSAFAPERRPSVGSGPITDQSAARVIAQSGRALWAYEGRLTDFRDLEHERVRNGCLVPSPIPSDR